MTGEEIVYVQYAIGHQFKNLTLLHQAFTRKSYSAEHPEVQDNEILEFYGDEILDFFVTKKMYECFSKIVNNRFVSERNEGELTKLKSIIVSKESLARCMNKFGFSKFLYLGKSDEQNNVRESASVNEDLFEAIIGAVAADCNWDYQQLERVCKIMLKMESNNPFLSFLIKEKSNALGFGEPVHYPMDSMSSNSFWGYLGEISKNSKAENHKWGIKIGTHKFLGVGAGSEDAKFEAEKKAYRFLCREEIIRIFKDLDYENAVSTLHELFQKKIIMEPIYEFNEYHDENGNPIWNCKIILEGYGSFFADDTSKKYVKQLVALKLLKYIIENPIEEKEGDWEIPVRYSGKARLWSDEEKARHEAEFVKVVSSKESK